MFQFPTLCVQNDNIMLDERTSCLCDGSGTEAVVDLAVVVLVAAVEASLVRVAQVAPLQVNMHFAQSESKEIINSAWHFFPVMYWAVQKNLVKGCRQTLDCYCVSCELLSASIADAL